MKRYYLPNLEVHAYGYTISVSTGGSAYCKNDSGAMEKISSIWFPTRRILQVELPDGRICSLRPKGQELEVLHDEKNTG